MSTEYKKDQERALKEMAINLDMRTVELKEWMVFIGMQTFEAIRITHAQNSETMDEDLAGIQEHISEAYKCMMVGLTMGKAIKLATIKPPEESRIVMLD